MRKAILITSLLILFLACKSEKNSKIVDPDTSEAAKAEYNELISNQSDLLEETANNNDISHDTEFEEISISFDPEEKNKYTFDRFKEEFNNTYDNELLPIGTYFWDEFKGIEMQYRLAEDESKLLGEWMNVTFMTQNYYNTYVFYPNKFFLLHFKYGNYHIIDHNELYLYNALGTWEIINKVVKITIYAIITEDRTKNYPYNKDVFYVEHPYTVDFINIDDIGKEGYTRQPINDAILSEELQQMVIIKEPNSTNNLYVRNVYTMDVIPTLKKNYHYFQYFPEMTRENHSGLDIVMNPELIKKYIPDWMY